MSREVKPKTQEDLRVMMLTATCEELRKALNAEIKKNVALTDEVEQLRREINLNLGRTS